MPKTKNLDIIKYWQEDALDDKGFLLYGNGDECGMALDVSELDTGRCWRCATTKNVQRCHIVGESQGGLDEPSNLILLCKDCHDDAPMTKNATAESIFNWIKKSRRLIVEPFRKSRFALAYNLCLSGCPPENTIGNYWTLKVYRLALELYDCDILERKVDLFGSFVNLIKEKFPPSEADDSQHSEVCQNLCVDWLRELALEDIGMHFPQKSGLTESKYQSEAFANVESIKHIESHLEAGCEETIKAIKSFFNEKDLREIDKELGFPLFFLDPVESLV